MSSVRSMELAGHDPHAVLAEAITRGGLHDANSVSDVLRYRIRLLEDGGRTPERAVRDGDWTTFATPWAGPVGAYARVLAAAATARQTELGERAAADPPPWALASSSLGAPPADPRQRGEWVRRAGIVAAYRDLHAIPEAQLSIGEAPSRDRAFHHALWRQAITALGHPADALDYATASDGELREMRDAWRRAQAWAPEFVAADLHDARELAEEYRRDAVIWRAGLDRHPVGSAEREMDERDVAAAEHLAAVCVRPGRGVGAHPGGPHRLARPHPRGAGARRLRRRRTRTPRPRPRHRRSRRPAAGTVRHRRPRARHRTRRRGRHADRHRRRRRRCDCADRRWARPRTAAARPRRGAARGPGRCIGRAGRHRTPHCDPRRTSVRSDRGSGAASGRSGDPRCGRGRTCRRVPTARPTAMPRCSPRPNVQPSGSGATRLVRRASHTDRRRRRAAAAPRRPHRRAATPRPTPHRRRPDRPEDDEPIGEDSVLTVSQAARYADIAAELSPPARLRHAVT